MLTRINGEIAPGIYLFNIGSSCSYCVGRTKLSLFDPGVSVHLDQLLGKIAQTDCHLDNLSAVFITHLHADRVGAIPYLKSRFPKIKLVTSQPIATELSKAAVLREIWQEDKELGAALNPSFKFMPFKKFQENFTVDTIALDGELIPIERNIGVRIIAAPGHTEHSVAYLIQPQNILIVDEGIGYFRLNGFSALGSDYSLEKNLAFLTKISTFQISQLCLPQIGVVTGSLVNKHINTIISTAKDLIDECKEAYEAGMNEQEIFSAIRTNFYTSEPTDPILTRNYERSAEQIWPQINRLARE